MNTGTILDAHDAAHPVPWWRRRAAPSALQLATAALEECRRDQLEHAQKQEYHAAMSKMLKERDRRLMADIQRLSRVAKQHAEDAPEALTSVGV
jgi:hypothetical protein